MTEEWVVNPDVTMLNRVRSTRWGYRYRNRIFAVPPLTPDDRIVGLSDTPGGANSMSGKIQIIGPDEVEAVSEYDGLVMQRDLASKATGSTRMKFIHDVIVDGAEFEDAVYEEQDQTAYIISGEMELIYNGQTHVLGPGHFFFVPQGIVYSAKVTSGPLQVIGVYSPSD